MCETIGGCQSVPQSGTSRSRLADSSIVLARSLGESSISNFRLIQTQENHAKHGKTCKRYTLACIYARAGASYSHTSHIRATRKYDDKRHGARYDIIDPLVRFFVALERECVCVCVCVYEREREREKKLETEPRYARFVQLHEPRAFSLSGPSIRFSGSERENPFSSLLFFHPLFFPLLFRFSATSKPDILTSLDRSSFSFALSSFLVDSSWFGRGFRLPAWESL